MGQVDELAELRREAKANGAKQKLIKQRLLAGLEPLVDRDHVAEIRPHVTLRPVERVAEPIMRTNGVRETFYHAAD